MSNAVAKFLNIYLANLHVFYAKTHNYHWNVEGKQFFAIHAKLEEVYESTADEIDEIAERILMIGARPLSTLAEYVEIATLKEAKTEKISGEDAIKNLLGDIKKLNDDLAKGIKLAQDAGDEVTADLLIDSSADYEKNIWMFNAYLK